MDLALFDLDNTLLNGDSDHAWGLFLAAIGVVDQVEQKEQQDYFYAQYSSGKLDMTEFLNFQLKPLKENNLKTLHKWRARYVDEVVQGMIDSGRADLLTPHREAGDKLVIITATNDFITRPIADALGVTTLIATTAEFSDGQYTGHSIGVPCFQDGKIKRLEEWLAGQSASYNKRYFYSDSINDLPLLELVDVPIAVNPDPSLRAHAEQLHWKIID